MESDAKGCEVVVSGKLRGQRAKSMKFTDGFMIHSGYPTQEYIDMAVRHVYLRQGEYLVSSNYEVKDSGSQIHCSCKYDIISPQPCSYRQ